MKRFLLSTTAVVGVSAMAASAVAMPLQSRDEEGTPVLSAAINASFEGGFANNSAANDDVNRDSGLVAGRWADVYFNGEMTADNGLTYGAQIRLAAGGGGAENGGFNNIDLLGMSGLGRQYLYVKGSWGSIEAGTWIGAATALNLNVAGQYKGNGGLDFSYKAYIVAPPGAITNIQNPHWWDAGETKITYFTPVFNGFQAGVTYTPTNSPWGQAKTGLTAGDGEHKDVISYGAQWKGDMGGSTVTVSAVGAMSDDSVQNPQPMGGHRHDMDGMVVPTGGMTPGATRHGIEMFQISGMVAHAGFTTGATFWDYGDTNMLPGDSQDYSGWALDATYSFGPYGIEISYAHAERMLTGSTSLDSTFDGWALQIGYAVAPGLKWYADLVGNEWDVNGNTEDSTVVLTGVNVNF